MRFGWAQRVPTRSGSLPPLPHDVAPRCGSTLRILCTGAAAGEPSERAGAPLEVTALASTRLGR